MVMVATVVMVMAAVMAAPMAAVVARAVGGEVVREAVVDLVVVVVMVRYTPLHPALFVRAMVTRTRHSIRPWRPQSPRYVAYRHYRQ